MLSDGSYLKNLCSATKTGRKAPYLHPSEQVGSMNDEDNTHCSAGKCLGCECVAWMGGCVVCMEWIMCMGAWTSPDQIQLRTSWRNTMEMSNWWKALCSPRTYPYVNMKLSMSSSHFDVKLLNDFPKEFYSKHIFLHSCRNVRTSSNSTQMCQSLACMHILIHDSFNSMKYMPACHASPTLPRNLMAWGFENVLVLGFQFGAILSTCGAIGRGFQGCDPQQPPCCRHDVWI